jgi:hypothetical protein
VNAQPPTPIAEGPRLVATLKCYAADGANAAEILVHADGSTRVRQDSETSLLQAPLLAIRGFDLRRLGNRRAA